jgi:hypothetical protein
MAESIHIALGKEGELAATGGRGRTGQSQESQDKSSEEESWAAERKKSGH